MPRRFHGGPSPDAELPEPPSRSQRKRDSTALQKVGEALTRLGAAELERMPLPPDLREAVREWARIPSREGRRRQMQYIGRLMREQADAAAVAAALAARDAARGAQTGALRRVEALREELLTADDPRAACAAFGPRAAALYRLTIRAREERKNGSPPHAFRALFRALRELSEQPEARSVSPSVTES